MTSACDNLWEAVDGSFFPNGNGNLDTLTSPNPAHGTAERVSLLEDRTIVTEETRDSDGSESPPEDADSAQYQEDDDSDSEISSYFGNANHGVPAEVKLVSYHENGNDDLPCHESNSEPSDEESEEELNSEDSGEDENDRDSASEYETDEDSVESERSKDDDLMDESSCVSAPSRISRSHDVPAPSEDSQHELFLPWDVSPSVQSLKYEEEEDDESSDEEDEPHYFHRTYMSGIGRSGRPRMWDGCPCGVSVSSDSGSSSGSSQGSKCSKRSRESAKTGVSFSDSVTVYPVFEKAAYPPSVVESIYTKREELRVNKLRNKREFAYDRYDWRNATEEDEMEPDEAGELIHPVHCEENIQPSLTRTRKAVQTYSSTLGGYTIGSVNSSGAIHQAKRMRMYHL